MSDESACWADISDVATMNTNGVRKKAARNSASVWLIANVTALRRRIAAGARRFGI
jgi:hypothetical protein